MNIKVLKKLIIVVILLCVLLYANTFTYAMSVSTENTHQIQQEEIVKIAGIKDIVDAGNNFIENGEEGANKIASEEKINISPEGFAKRFVDIGSILVAIGVVVLLIVYAIMGIKWITAQPDKKAKLKDQLIGLVIATVVIFGAIGIWKMVQTIMNNVEGSFVEDLDPASQVTTPETTIPQTVTTTVKP